MFIRADLSLVVFIALHPAIDVKIHYGKIAVAFLLPADLDLLRTVLMVKQIHPLADEWDWRFEQVSIQGESSVIGHSSAGNGAKMLFQIIRRCPQALHARSKPLQGLFACPGVDPLVIDLSAPQIKGPIECIKAHLSYFGQKLPPYGSEPSLYLPLALRFVGLCMDQGDPQGCSRCFDR